MLLFLSGGFLAACVIEPWPPAPSQPKPAAAFKEAVEAMVRHLMSQLLEREGDLRGGNVAIALEPFMEVRSGEVLRASLAIEKLIMQTLKKDFPRIKVGLLNSRTLKQSNHVPRGIIGNYVYNPDSQTSMLKQSDYVLSGVIDNRAYNPDSQIKEEMLLFATLVATKARTIVASTYVWLENEESDFTPVGIYHFSRACCGISSFSNAMVDQFNTKANAEYLSTLETRALLMDAEIAYENKEYQRAQTLLNKAKERKDYQRVLASFIKLEAWHDGRLERYPTIECQACENYAIVAQEFTVQISLTQNQFTPKVQITKGKTAKSGKMQLNLPEQPDVPEQDAWLIDVTLVAPGFKLRGQDNHAILLPHNGDSDPARFLLTPNAIQTSPQTRKIYTTFWHKSTFLGKAVREVTIVKPEQTDGIKSTDKRDNDNIEQAESVALDGFAQSPANMAAPASMSRLSARSLRPRGRIATDLDDRARELSGDKKDAKQTLGLAASSADTESPAKQKIDPVFTLSKSPPDLTVFLLHEYLSGPAVELRTNIYSPHLRPVHETSQISSGLSDWLRDYYAEWGQQGRGKVMRFKTNTSGKKRRIQRLKAFGKKAWRDLAPRAFKEAFWQIKDRFGDDFTSIQIITDDPLLPWELMRPFRVMNGREQDEQDFLGMDFRIARLHVSPTPSGSTPQRLTIDDFVVMAPNYSTDKALSNVADEVAALKTLPFARQVSGNYPALRDLFKDNPPGMFHFAGHGVVESGRQGSFRYAIRLEDGKLDPWDWRDFAQTESEAGPLVFFNACDIGQGDKVANFVDGWAPAILESGASGYIGGLWPLGDHGAAEFAKEFYQYFKEELAKGAVPIAEILRKTRRRFYENGDPTFLAYVYYGDPDLTVTYQATHASAGLQVVP